MWYNKYIGIPYKDGGRDESGLDCWGLVRLVYKDKYSIDLPSFTSQYTTAKDIDLIHELIARHKESWEKTSEPKEGSVVLMRILGTETHVGVYLGNNNFLHVREGTHAVVESIDSISWKHRIVGYFDYNQNFKEIINSTISAHPLKTEKITVPIITGTSLEFLADWVKAEYKITDKLMSHAVFLLNGQAIPEPEWKTTLVREGDSLEYRSLPRGGSTLRVIAFIALAVAAPYLANAVMGGSIGVSAYAAAGTAGLAGGLGAGTLMAGIVTTGVMLAGSSLINAIAPIRPPDIPNQATPSSSQAQNFINGAKNQPMQYGAIPVVLGKMRVTPPIGATNYISFSSNGNIESYAVNGGYAGVSGRDTYVDMLLVWGYGPLYIDPQTLRIGQVSVYKDSSLTTTNYDGFEIMTLDRISEPTTDQLNYFNSIYGRDTQEYLPNQPLAYAGLPPIRRRGPTDSMPWTPQPRPASDTGWVEYGFSQNTEQVSFAISFPQGLRAIIIKGDAAGQEKAAPVQFEIDYKYNSGTGWTGWLKDWGRFTVGGSLAETSSSSSYQEYVCDEYGCSTVTKVTGVTTENEILTGGVYADGFTWTMTKNRSWPINSQVQVRVRRTTGDETEPNENYRYSHQAVLQAVTSFNNANPCIDPPGAKLAKTAITIKATDEINGQIDGINAEVQTICPDWDSASQTWITRKTSNPASLYRYVLQHPGNPQKVPDSQLDLAQLQHWHEYCSAPRVVLYNGVSYTNVTLQYNSILAGSQRGVLEVLRDICAAGRASPAMLDGKWSVVIDEPKSTVVQHFTPHNSWGFEATKLLPRMPEALKVQFTDRESNYAEKEVIVSYADKSPTTAQLLEAIQLPGITSTAEAVDHARWHLAQIKLRPEVYTINADIEYIVCSRGDRVRVSHDVPGWGTGSGRLKNLYGNSESSITVLELDEQILIDTSKNYTIRVRNSSTGGNTSFGINKVFGISHVGRANNVVSISTISPHPLSVDDIVNIQSSVSDVNLSTAKVTSVTHTGDIPSGFTYEYNGADIPTAAANGSVLLTNNYYTTVQISTATTTSVVAPDDLFLVGEVNKDSQDLIVTKIEPTSSKTARITLVDYGVTSEYNIFTDYPNNISSNVIFNSNITQPSVNLVSQVGTSKPIVDVSQVSSGIDAANKLSPVSYQYAIKVPYTNPPGLSNDIGFVMAEIIPANTPDTSGARTFKADITLGSISFTGVQENDTYRYRLRYVTKSGNLGTWTEWFGHKVAGKLTNYFTPPELVLDLDGTYVTALPVADVPKPVDFKTYEYRLYKYEGTGSFWDLDTQANNILVEQSLAGARFNLLDITTPRIDFDGVTYTVACRAVDTFGNYSTDMSVQTITIRTIQ